jgi:hypothetical protein
MAHFAEINKNNKVIRVVVACNIDIENNGGEKSEQAAEVFKNVIPLSKEGIKWVQTSYNTRDGKYWYFNTNTNHYELAPENLQYKAFRKKFAGVGDTYDPVKDIFWNENKPYPSWTLDSNYDWQPPIPKPLKNTWGENNAPLYCYWDEQKLNWVANGYQIEESTPENPGTITSLVWNNTTQDWDLA